MKKNSYMKVKVKKVLLFLYYEVFYNMLKLLPINKKKIVFESYYGKSYSCNPKYLYRYIKENFNDYECIWVYNSNNVPKEIQNCKIVKRKSFKFIFQFATSKFWITNCNMPGELKPRKETVYIQTWHGVPLKRIGEDIENDLGKLKSKWRKDGENIDLFISSSEKLNEIYSRSLYLEKSKISSLGSPRNDIFFGKDQLKIVKEKMMKEYKLNFNKKIILYAPTFRDDELNQNIKLDFEKLNRELSDRYILLIRLHSNVSKTIEIDEKLKEFVYNVSEYDDIQELFLVSDILITDYSSTMFDYAITGRPLILYAYDLEHYEKNLRGFYFNYKEFVPGPIVYNENEIINLLEDYEKLHNRYNKKVLDFAKEFNDYFDGEASKRIVEKIIRI